jgi:hypothetical protein
VKNVAALGATGASGSAKLALSIFYSSLIWKSGFKVDRQFSFRPIFGKDDFASTGVCGFSCRDLFLYRNDRL